MTDPIPLALIYGSTRQGRFCDVVAAWAAEEVRGFGKFSLDLIDPAEKIPGLTGESGDGGALSSLRQRIAAADAFLVVTPEYNHGYPAPLKSLIDSVGQEWHAKPVAFVSYGGVSGGLRAVEQLRLVFAELNAVSVRDSVSFPGAWEQFDGSGQLVHPERHKRSMTAMLHRLHWWAVALGKARTEMPFAAAA